MRRLILLGKQALKVLRNRDPVCQLVQLLAETVDGLLVHVRLGDELWEVGYGEVSACYCVGWRKGWEEKGREGKRGGKRVRKGGEGFLAEDGMGGEGPSGEGTYT